MRGRFMRSLLPEVRPEKCRAHNDAAEFDSSIRKGSGSQVPNFQAKVASHRITRAAGENEVLLAVVLVVPIHGRFLADAEREAAAEPERREEVIDDMSLDRE